MQQTISLLVEDRPGVLSRISGLVSRKGYNVDSLSIGKTEQEGLSRLTMVVDGGEKSAEQIVRQFRKLVETVDVKLLNTNPFVERWMTLIKVRASFETRPHILQTAEVFRSKVIDIGEEALVLESTGDRGKVEAFIEAVKPFGILEVASSGAVAMQRGGFGATF
ncbi:MAG: acetolactate synthase small subunit [Thermovirga sp.]|jgi:acetolactate synthase-1/3 small subunit|nr:acetolactate synthase small subunit [Thermovirga sp.]